MPWDAWASIACSVIYFVALYLDSHPSALRGLNRWYYHREKFIAFIILFGISVGLLMATIRLRRWIAASFSLPAVLIMGWYVFKWVNRYY